MDFAIHGTTSQLERAVAGYRTTNRLDDQDANDRHHGRYLRWWLDDDGMVCFEGRLTPEDAAVVIAAIQAATIAPTRRSPERIADQHGEIVPQPGDDPKEARQADALVALCRGDRADKAGSGTTVIVHVDQDTLTDDADGACHLEGSANLSPSLSGGSDTN